MSYGISFDGNLGNACFSEKASSVVFMGKATNKGSYSSTFHNRGCSFMYHVNYNHYRSFSHGTYCVGGGLSMTRDSLEGDWGTYYINRVDNYRICVFEVESYEKPMVFMHYSTPSTYGGLVIKTVDNGGTGPRGYPKWDITVWLWFSNGNYTAAANSLTLYCFSKMPTNYTNGGYGLAIKDASGKTMFHSDFEPAQIKGILDINTPANLSWTGTFSEYNPITKYAYLSKDAGRIRRIYNAGSAHSFEYHTPIVGFEKLSGTNWNVKEGGAPLFRINDYTSSDTYLGDTQLIVPIIDGADYD
jgi:hypothetical protein